MTTDTKPKPKLKFKDEKKMSSWTVLKQLPKGTRAGETKSLNKK